MFIHICHQRSGMPENCRRSGMEKWDAGEVGCQRSGMPEKWDARGMPEKWGVSQIKLFFPTAHYSDKIRTSEMAD